MEKFTVTCGTDNLDTFEVNLEDFGSCREVASTEDEKKEAFNLLVKTMNDETFADDGHRNDDAVNTVIALHVLGYNANKWLHRFCAAQPDGRFWPSDLRKFLEHVERVDLYVRDWGPDGDEGHALLYALWN